jgi:ribosomal-protein-alanine N-acetyltransferase
MPKKNANPLIRGAQPSDFPALLEIDAVSFPTAVAYSASDLSHFMNRAGAITLVLECDGSIAAFMIAEVASQRKAATIITIDVLDEFRRRGFASLLLERMEEILAERGAKTCKLEVDVGNAGAITFYEKRGFKTVRRLKNYYANGADAWRMEKGYPFGG